MKTSGGTHLGDPAEVAVSKWAGRILPKSLLSSATGVFLGIAGSLGGETLTAATWASEREDLVADTRPPLGTRRYVVVGERTELARQVIREALGRYRQSDGYEGHLVKAAWQLEQVGMDAWPALTEMAYSGVPECEFFLGAMVRAEGIGAKVRMRALKAAIKHSDANVRSRMLELADEMPNGMKWEIVLALASSDNPDDAATDRAREAVQGLAS